MGDHDYIISWALSPWWWVSVAIQFGLIIHVLKTGRPYWWIPVILFFPLAGSAIYFFAELAPGFRPPSWSQLRWRLLSPARRVAHLQEVLEDSDTFANHVALAEEFRRQKRFGDAAQAYECCLSGLYQDDAYALLDLARCYDDLGQPQKAKSVLDRLDLSSARELTGPKTLLEAQTLEALGQKPAAGRLYESIALTFPGEEPRYRWACLLLESGQADQARPLLQGILKKYRQAGSRWRQDQKTWFRLAKARLKELH